MIFESFITEEVPSPEEAVCETPPAKAEESSLILDDLIRAVTKKLNADKSNNDKVKKLIGSYGVKKVSEIPAEKYEEFLKEVEVL